MLKLLLGAASYTLTCKMKSAKPRWVFRRSTNLQRKSFRNFKWNDLLSFHWESMWKIELMGQIVAQQYNTVVNIWISSRKKCGYLVLPVCWRSFASQKQTSGPKWSQLSCYLRKLGHAHSHKNGTCRWTPTTKTRDSNFGNHRFQAPSFVLDHVFFGVFSFVRFWTFSDLKFQWFLEVSHPVFTSRCKGVRHHADSAFEIAVAPESGV